MYAYVYVHCHFMKTDPESRQLKQALELVKATATHCNAVRSFCVDLGRYCAEVAHLDTHVYGSCRPEG